MGLGLAGLVVHLLVARPAWWFTVLPDEAGYLGNARWLIGGPDWPMGDAPRYGIGTSLLYVPAMAFGRDARQVVALAGVTNAVVLALLAPVLAAAVRRLVGCTPAVALAAGGVGALVPIAVLGGTVMWAEAAVLVAVGAFAVGVAGRPRWWWAAMCGALPWVHLRLLPFAVVGVVVLVTRRCWPLLATTLAVALVGGLGQWAVERSRWDRIVGPPVSDGLRRPGSALTQLVGEGWYLLVSTGALAGLGAVVVWQRVRRGDRGALALAVAGAALIGLSAVSSAASAHRPEQYVYGRYVDALAPLLVALGVTWVLRAGLRPRRAGSLAMVGVTVAAALVVVGVRGTSVFDGRWQTTQVMGLAWLGSSGGVGRIWLATALAVLAVVAWGGLPGRWAVAALAGGLVASNLGAWAGPLTERRDQYAGWTVPAELSALDVEMVAYDLDAANPVGRWAYPLLFDDADVVTFTDEVPADADAVIGSLDRPVVSGAPSVRDERFGVGVWLLDR